MTTGRINQVTDAPFVGEGAQRATPHSRRCRSTKATDRPLADSRSDFAMHLTPGRVSHQTPHRRTTPNSPPSRRYTSWPPGARENAVVRRRPRTPAGHHGPWVLRRARDRRTRTALPTDGTASPVWGNSVHPNRNSPYMTL